MYLSVLRDAIAATGKIALSRVVIARRERPVAIMPMGKGLVIHTLHDERDLNDHEGLFEALPDGKPDPDMVELATQLIGRQVGRYDPADVEDRYEARLRAVIEAKLQGEGIAPDAEEEPDRGNVIDLMAALRKSLGQGAPAKPATKSATKVRAPTMAEAEPPAAKPATKKRPAKTSSPPKRPPARKRA